LVGFIVGALVIGKLVEIRKDRGFLWFLACMIAGTVTIYLFGVIQLMNWAEIDLGQAVIMGVLPFIFGDLVKIFVAAYVAQRVWRTLPNLIPRALKEESTSKI